MQFLIKKWNYLFILRSWGIEIFFTGIYFLLITFENEKYKTFSQCFHIFSTLKKHNVQNIFTYVQYCTLTVVCMVNMHSKIF